MSRQNRKRIFTQQNDSPPTHKFQFNIAWGAVPHPEKAWKGGEDAIFTSKNVLAVADGVSGWSQYGIDSGIYSRKLINNIILLLQGQRQLYYIEHPAELALIAVQMTQDKGSSTLSILTLHPITGIMRSFHVGDSIYGVFKTDGALILGEQQQLSFDVPFQVYGGKSNLLQVSAVKTTKASDIFKGAYNQFHYTQINKSAIILASDGLWDNIHTEEIKQILAEKKDITVKAKDLLQRTILYYKLRDYESPYYKKGLAKGLKLEKKGKIDDISIIVAEVHRLLI